METLAAEMICGSLPVPNTSLPQLLACWGVRFPAEDREKGCSPSRPVLSCHQRAFISADHLLMPLCASLPRGLWGYCTFTRTFTLFPSLFQGCACSSCFSWGRAL